jgi:hypothetical protein
VKKRCGEWPRAERSAEVRWVTGVGGDVLRCTAQELGGILAAILMK